MPRLATPLIQEANIGAHAAEAYFSTFRTAPADRPFLTVIVGDRREAINWGEFRRLTFLLAHQMLGRGVGRGDVVLIFFPHQRWLLPTFFAAQLIGAIPSFMPAMSPRQDLALFRTSHAALIADIVPALLCVDAMTDAALGSPGVPRLRLEELDALDREDVDFREPDFQPADGPALLQHSSGTTGLKKGVVLSYDAVMAQLGSYGRALGLTGSETIVSWLPVYHDMGLMAATLLPFVSGTPVVAMGAFDWLVRPWRLLDEMAEVPGALTWLPNFAFASIARVAARAASDLRLDTVRAFINCSEPCTPDIVDRFVAAFATRGVRPEQLQTCYAMAENSFAATQSRPGASVMRWCGPDERARALLSCGTAIDGVEIEIRDPDGNRMLDGVVGEIHVSGTSLFDGYRNQPELTASKLRDGWYATGDLGAIHAGELFVTGRRDELIIIAGRSLYAHEIEEEVAKVTGVKPGRVCAFGVRNEGSGTEDLVVLMETTADAPAAPELERAVRERLAGTILVSTAQVVSLAGDTLVKTTSGKISRTENRARFAAGNLVSWGTRDDR